MHPSEQDAEIVLLREQLREALSAVKTSDLLAAEVERLRLRETQCRRVNCRVPAAAYEVLEDIGILEGARVGMMRLWHKDNHEFRKALLHLTKLQWDLREKLRKML